MLALNKRDMLVADVKWQLTMGTNKINFLWTLTGHAYHGKQYMRLEDIDRRCLKWVKIRYKKTYEAIPPWIQTKVLITLRYKKKNHGNETNKTFLSRTETRQMCHGNKKGYYYHKQNKSYQTGKTLLQKQIRQKLQGCGQHGLTVSWTQTGQSHHR